MKIRKIILYVLLLIFIFTGTVFGAELNEANISVPSAILVETNTNKILYEKNANQKMYPASTTKIMTSILILENCTLDEEVIVTYDAISKVPNGYSKADLIVGEILTVEQLLHLTLIESANDAAILLAEHMSGSIESFASVMNTKAYEIGCTNTHFVNPDGQHDENHYSTAHDLYLIADYAMKNETFKSIVKKNLYVLYPTNKYDKERKIYNTNQLIDPTSVFHDTRATGVKTGFTTPAGNCLVASATSNDVDIIVVVLGGLVENNNTSQRYLSARNLLRYAFDNYSYQTIATKDSYFQTVEITNATSETKNLKILVKDDISVFIDNETFQNNITPEVTLNTNLFAPIKAGDVVGTISYNILGIDYTTELIAANDVQVSEFATFLFTLAVFILIIYVVFKMIRKK